MSYTQADFDKADNYMRNVWDNPLFELLVPMGVDEEVVKNWANMHAGTMMTWAAYQLHMIDESDPEGGEKAMQLYARVGRLGLIFGVGVGLYLAANGSTQG